MADKKASPLRIVASAQLPTVWGTFRMYGFEAERQNAPARTETAVALIMGNLGEIPVPPLARIHSECLTGDVFGSCRCDCGDQLRLSMSMIAEEKRGIVIYEQQEGRGIGLMWKMRAYELQDLGLDTIEANEKLGFKADYRTFDLPARILASFGVKAVRLLSNSPDKIRAMKNHGITVVDRISCEASTVSTYARNYLAVKKNKLGHMLTLRSEESCFPE